MKIRIRGGACVALLVAACVALPAYGQQPAGQGGGLGQAPETPTLDRDEGVPKMREPGPGEIVFDYKEASLVTIIQQLGARTGKNFEIDPAAGQLRTTVYTYAPVPEDLAFEILGSLLQSQGYTMIPALDGHLIKVVKASPAGGPEGAGEEVPLVFGETEDVKGFSNFETHVLPVTYADAEEVSQIMTEIGSKYAKISVYGPTNTLVITDTASGLNRMLQVLRVVDIPGNEILNEIFVLEYTSAETVATQLQDVLLGTDGTGEQGAGRRTPSAPIATPAGRRAIPGQVSPGVVVGSVEETLRVVHDERLNAVIVTASEGMMEKVHDLIMRLDQPAPDQAQNMHVFDLQNADAEIVAEALNNMISGTTPRAGSPQQGAQSGEVQPFEKSVTITAYLQTNTLLILASPQDYKRLTHIISQLDVPARQVHVESIIMDVIIDDSESLQVNLAGLDDQDWFGFNNAATLANALVTGPLGLAGAAGGTIGVIDGTTTIPSLDGTGTQTVPNIPLLLQFIETLTAVDILSQPALTTVDNEEAHIIVGQNVPFIVGSQSSLNQNATNSSVFNRIEREDVGIQLTVTPQISEGDYIFLDLAVEVSQTVASDVGADVNSVGPTLQKSEVTSKVTIQDGSIGIIGGLVSEQVNQSRNQSPILGDVPVIGWLFRNRGGGRNKRNLVVLVSPTIVRDATDVERLTDWKLDLFTEANMDAWFEDGFISKVKHKRDMRRKYRPSVKHTDSYRGDREGFDRGGAE